MYDPFLLTRVLLRFGTPSEDVHGELSALTISPDGSLWTGSDELLSVERLSPQEPHMFGDHTPFYLGDFVELFDQESEIDIEGMDFSHHYLWFTGSHSTKRKKAKGKKPDKDLERLTHVKADANRYLIGRIPVVNGRPLKTSSHPQAPETTMHAGTLQKTRDSNILFEALTQDPHIGEFLSFSLPSKDNGFDIEGLAVHGQRVFLGLRGPVTRGWAIMIEIEIAEPQPGVLTLNELGDHGARYRKHFLDLNGLGIRDLCFRGDDLIILAGPTMQLEGAMEVFQMREALDLDENSLSWQGEDGLELLFNLPFTIGSDHAEGVALYSCLGYPDSLLVVYDSPDPQRQTAPDEVMADVFRLE